VFKKKFKKKREPLFKSFQYAFEGFQTCISSERNLIIHFIFMILVIFLGFFFSIKTSEWIVCILLFGAVISAELFNTAIETTVDICSPEIRPQAKIAKDTAAAAVLTLAISSLVIGILIFLPYVLEFLK